MGDISTYEYHGYFHQPNHFPTTDLCDVKLHRVLRDPELAKCSDHCPMFIDIKEK